MKGGADYKARKNLNKRKKVGYWLCGRKGTQNLWENKQKGVRNKPTWSQPSPTSLKSDPNKKVKEGKIYRERESGRGEGENSGLVGVLNRFSKDFFN